MWPYISVVLMLIGSSGSAGSTDHTISKTVVVSSSNRPDFSDMNDHVTPTTGTIAEVKAKPMSSLLNKSGPKTGAAKPASSIIKVMANGSG